jgi:hypothetical protein
LSVKPLVLVGSFNDDRAVELDACIKAARLHVRKYRRVALVNLCLHYAADA